MNLIAFKWRAIAFWFKPARSRVLLLTKQTSFNLLKLVRMTNILSLSWYRDKPKINSIFKIFKLIFNCGLPNQSNSLNVPIFNRSLN